MESSSLVVKARTALHNAAAKAERVLIELKQELSKPSNTEVLNTNEEPNADRELSLSGQPEVDKCNEGECRQRVLDIFKSPNGFMVTKLEEMLAKDHPSESHCVQGILESAKKDERQETKRNPVAVSIPPSKFLRRLASAIEVGRTFRSMQELALHGKEDKDSSQVADWSSLVSGFATVRKLSMWEKEAKEHMGLGVRRYQHLLKSLFDADVLYEEDTPLKEGRAKLLNEIHGAPPQSFVARLAQVLASMKTVQRMADFWLEVLSELRHHWSEGTPIPCVPFDADPDLSCCLLHQQLQVVNCCIARRKRRSSALESLEMLETAGACTVSSSPSTASASCGLSAKQKSGQYVLRLGADRIAAGLRMLETGEPIYSPVTQEGPVLTEDQIKENEELVLRTGSFGAGCSHLFADMQAFKAANPGCILEDFVRWYSPLDWVEDGESRTSDNKDCEKETSVRGHLSARMQSEGNLWQELWFSARPVPAVKQAPLFDEELAGESTLDALEAIDPSSFFEQLFTTALGVGFSVAEAAPCAKLDSLMQCLKECRGYVISTCRRGMSAETLEHLCEVYELMVTATNAASGEKSHLKIFAHDKGILNTSCECREDGQPIQVTEVDISSNTKTFPANVKVDSRVNVVIRFLEAKASIFERKSKSNAHADQKPNALEGDWTLV